jgi:tetrahydromethanopterin S-methyltransferase subunit C
MKNLFKKTYNHPALKHILIALGVVAVIDWIIFPSLTAPSTVFNILGLLIAALTGIFVGVYVKENFLDKN